MENPTVAPSGRPVGTVKSELLEQVARVELNLADIQPLIRELQLNWRKPETEEAFAPLLDGNWELVYTSTPALARSGLDALPGLQRGKTYQCIDVAAGRVRNVAELTGPFGLAGLVVVSAGFELENLIRIRVAFEQTAILWGGLAGYSSVQDAIERVESGEGVGLRLPVSSEGTVDTLYVDEDLRIGLGNRGTLFILRRP